MEKVLFLGTHFLLPIITVLVICIPKHKSRLSLILKSVTGIAFLGILFQWGQWALVGSIYLKFLILLGILLILSKVLLDYHKGYDDKQPSLFGYLLFLLLVAMGLFFLYINFKLIQGRFYPKDHVELSFPLKDGSYYISSGGSNKFINNHFRNFPNSQQYAIDISKLGPVGSATKNIFKTGNEYHHIFQEAVYSPCDGRVIAVENDVNDNLKSSMNVSAKDGQGNYVKLQCGDLIVAMVHLAKGSVQIRQGSEVNTGDYLGQVGNSGFSQEPHLHFEAARYNQDSVLVGVPLKLDGRMLVRNQVFKHESDE